MENNNKEKTDDEKYKEDFKKYEEEEKENKKLREDYYQKYKLETDKRQVSSSENFDKSILTYSSWALGISLFFLKDFIPINNANLPWLLYISWLLFFISISLTTSSFLISYKALEISLQYAYKYYIEKKDKYGEKKSCYAKTVEKFNIISAVSFIVGMSFTVIFVGLNLEKSAMTKKTIRGIGQDGMPPSLMQKIEPSPTDARKGLTPSGIGKVPPSPPPPQPPEKTQK